MEAAAVAAVAAVVLAAAVAAVAAVVALVLTAPSWAALPVVRPRAPLGCEAPTTAPRPICHHFSEMAQPSVKTAGQAIPSKSASMLRPVPNWHGGSHMRTRGECS